MTVLYAFFSALGFGVSDYFGGALSRREKSINVTATSQFWAFLSYIVLVFVFPGIPSFSALGYGALAGLCIVFGLYFFYMALADGVVGVVASVTALFSALVPAFWGLLRGDLFTVPLIVGIVIAVSAVIVLTIPYHKHGGEELLELTGRVGDMTKRVWLHTVLAGAGLSTSMILVSQTPRESGCWPLLGLGAVAALAAMVSAKIQTGNMFVQTASIIPIVGMTISLDVAYSMQLFAVRSGALAVASVVGALYPVPTILMAWGIDKEKLNRNQIAGALLALIAIALIALS
ncbi:MAG: EamA family transporter [Coriobacteriia bacterium]|nr:EamA family transporter [Coriobacteriia bacterium]